MGSEKAQDPLSGVAGVDTDDTKNDSITEAILRSLRVDLPDSVYHPEFHRGYVRPGHPEAQAAQRTTWVGPLDSKDFLPYYCPVGWRRFAVRVPEGLRRNEEFWRKSSNFYHGTHPQNVSLIIRNGFKPRLCQHGGKAVYMTPSIRYAAHPRYARIQRFKGRYYQVALQLRVVNEQLVDFKEVRDKLAAAQKGDERQKAEQLANETDTPETMGVGDELLIDENMDNNAMEKLWFSDKPFVTAEDGLVVTGVMVRCLGTDPIDLPENKWWQIWLGLDVLRSPDCFTDHGSST